MKQFKLIFFTILCFWASDTFGQGLHFSQYGFAPINVNPALAGAFNGTARINAIHRGQWWSVAGGNPLSGNGYNTLNLSVDSPIIRGIREQDWIGIGLSFVLIDQAGNGNYGAGGSSLMGLSYHFSLDKKQRSVLTLGIQRSTVSYSLTNNFDYISRPGLINGTLMDPDVNTLFQNQDMNFQIDGGESDFRVGLMLTTPMGKSADLRFGVAMANLFTPDKSIASGQGISGRDELPRRLMVFGQIFNSVSDRFLFKPGFFFQRQGATTEIQVNGHGSYLFNQEKDIWLNFGLGLRPVNATDVILFLGADVKDWRFGLSYDINLSGFSGATNSNGALEFAVSYIWKYYKKPKVDPTLVCPRI